MKKSDLQKEAKRVAALANSAGLQTTMIGESGWGWKLKDGVTRRHQVGRKYGNGEWKDMTTVWGALFLSTDGSLLCFDHEYGVTDETEPWNRKIVKEASVEDLAGAKGEPFAEVAQALRRLEAMVT
jgi:hypothetical protein